MTSSYDKATVSTKPMPWTQIVALISLAAILFIVGNVAVETWPAIEIIFSF